MGARKSKGPRGSRSAERADGFKQLFPSNIDAEYNSPPEVVINTDYAFIRLVDKSNGKTGARLIKERLRQTAAIPKKERLGQTAAIPKLVQVSKRDLAMNNDSLI